MFSGVYVLRSSGKSSGRTMVSHVHHHQGRIKKLDQAQLAQFELVGPRSLARPTRELAIGWW